jgi:hypothetical protein
VLLAVGHHNAQFTRVPLHELFLSVHGAEVEYGYSFGPVRERLGHQQQNLRRGHSSQGIVPRKPIGVEFLKSPRPSVVCILRHMTDAKWQPGPDSGWGLTFAGDAARRLWAILDHLDQALNGPDGDLIARLVAGDSEPGLFRHVVDFTRDDMATALGQPRPIRASTPMTYAEKVKYRPQLLENARGMLADVEVQVEAVERMSEIVSVIESAGSRSEAADRLQRPPFSYSVWQAFQVLDLSVASQTGAGAAVLRHRKEELVEAVRRLEEPIAPPGPA